jgi:hypothetical protein
MGMQMGSVQGQGATPGIFSLDCIWRVAEDSTTWLPFEGRGGGIASWQASQTAAGVCRLAGWRTAQGARSGPGTARHRQYVCRDRVGRPARPGSGGPFIKLSFAGHAV